jgi:hypothetical protein
MDIVKYGIWFLGLSAGLFGIGCSSSDGSGGSSGISSAAAAEFVGIYQTTGYSHNSTSCDAPGAPLLEGLQDKYFVAAAADEFGIGTVSIVSCNGVADCQAKRSKVIEGGFYASTYSYTLSNAVNATTLTGLYATTGFSEGTMCTGRVYADHTLTLSADHGLHLESRSKHLVDRPQQDGFCEVEPTKSQQEAASLPCSELEILDGSFVQAM